ncbi:hypothetical protein SDC9_188054 [bioreactor metagenome]|uniref:Uncharacterized protein n=1 Tax=bioreactor metagenome TaxID=1076179 RepID=A0A645HPL6_9ZZZZ
MAKVIEKRIRDQADKLNESSAFAVSEALEDDEEENDDLFE